jgi:hypothetical protein
MNAKAFGFAAAETSASPLGAAMPCNIDAEQALLGILLYDSSAFQRIIGLEARYFCEPSTSARLPSYSSSLSRTNRLIISSLQSV